jgi:hypothetical protein
MSVAGAWLVYSNYNATECAGGFSTTPTNLVHEICDKRDLVPDADYLSRSSLGQVLEFVLCKSANPDPEYQHRISRCKIEHGKNREERSSHASSSGHPASAEEKDSSRPAFSQGERNARYFSSGGTEP